jgi:hypothetical protein
MWLRKILQVTHIAKNLIGHNPTWYIQILKNDFYSSWLYRLTYNMHIYCMIQIISTWNLKFIGYLAQCIHSTVTCQKMMSHLSMPFINIYTTP